MFNLLMRGNGWKQHSDSLDQSRVFEYTSNIVTNQFKPNGILDVAAVIELPTIFVSETFYDNSQAPARIGRIAKIRQIGTTYHIDYVIDHDIPPIPNSVLQEYSNLLGLNTFSRTHWSIKEADLFESLLKAGFGKRAQPKVFNIESAVQDSKLVAVMMPFNASFDPVYQALQAAVADARMICKRADDIWENDHIIQDVVTLIARSSIVICDLTDRNANVFYEMGIAHTLGKEVIMITQSAADVPFDVSHIRHIRYLKNGEGMTALTEEVASRIKNLLERR